MTLYPHTPADIIFQIFLFLVYCGIYRRLNPIFLPADIYTNYEFFRLLIKGA